MIFTINLSDHLCEFIYLCFIQSVHYFLFSNRHHLKASFSIFFVMFEFRIWDWIPCFRAAQFRYGLLDKEKNAVGVTIANNNFIYSFLQLPRKRSVVICLWRRANNVTVVTNMILHVSGTTYVVKVAIVLGNLSQETVSFFQEKHAGWSLFSGRQYTRDVLYGFSKRQRKKLCKSQYNYLQQRSQYTSFVMFDRTSVLKIIYMPLTSVSITICLTPCK